MIYKTATAIALFLMAIVLFGIGRVQAQAPAPAKAPAPVAGGTVAHKPDPPGSLDLATAMKMVAGAQAAAVAKGQNIAVCVMDARGDMVAMERMDNVDIMPVTTAIGKAHSVLFFGVPTAAIADAIAAGRPVSVTIKAPVAGQDALTLLQGGLPIVKNGKLIGAIGVGGSSSEEDEQISQAGIDAAFPK